MSEPKGEVMRRRYIDRLEGRPVRPSIELFKEGCKPREFYA